ncbi:hypothetical protein V8G54_003960 [Vigna mungo]|uniref:Uncharacterized protein n=1 Tax=Vigna mungo TaxID=3915 RepID=A0AAQ3PCP2_VIGMU
MNSKVKLKLLSLVHLIVQSSSAKFKENAIKPDLHENPPDLLFYPDYFLHHYLLTPNAFQLHFYSPYLHQFYLLFHQPSSQTPFSASLPFLSVNVLSPLPSLFVLYDLQWK